MSTENTTRTRHSIEIDVVHPLCDTVNTFDFTAEADPGSPGGVRSTGVTFGPCVECGEIVSVPPCSESGHPWIELPTGDGVTTVCLVCKDRPYAPLKPEVARA